VEFLVVCSASTRGYSPDIGGTMTQILLREKIKRGNVTSRCFSCPCLLAPRLVYI